MSKGNDYEDILEAIGMLGSKSKVNNILNKVYSHSKDYELRDMIGRILSEMPYAGIKHEVVSLRSANGIGTKKIENYCRKTLGWDADSGPVSKY